jgi:anaerobic ribonucleoside-triphosphate reductase
MTDGHPFTVYRDIGDVWYKLNPLAFKTKPFARDVCQFLIHTAVTEGDAKGRTFTFPIPTINITKEFDWNGPLTDELFALTAKYGPYYFANFVKSDLNPKDSTCKKIDVTA